MKKILTALALSIISGLLLAQKSIVQTDQNTTVIPDKQFSGNIS